MTPTRRGRVVLTTVVTLVAVAAVVVGVLVIGGRAGVLPSGAGSPSGGPSSPASPSASPTPTVCPLTGKAADGGVPLRPALAIKVENLPASRPQTGLSWADIVYEEPVEGGITRFIAVYQCTDASRVEPVRSGRLTDPDILVQFGRPVFAFAGAVPPVFTAVREANLIDANYLVPRFAPAYHRDPARLAPHNLYTSTKALYAAAEGMYGIRAPQPVFTYATKSPKGRRIAQVHVPFSSSSDVFWTWSKEKNVWLRFHGAEAHVSSDGTQFSARNVVVQVVKITLTDITDANGVRSPEVVSTGTGKAYVFRNGRMIKGTWKRNTLDDITRFVDKNGDEIPLNPGNTWVELLPNDLPISVS